MKRPGYVLIAVLLVIVVLSLAGYRFVEAMSAEFAVAHVSGEAAQAKAHSVAGVHYAMALLSDPATFYQVLGGNPYDNEAMFAGIPVGSAQHRGGGRFALLNLADTGGGTGEAKFALKYGVTDEAGKINLNTMMRIDDSGESLRAMLILLPNMTEDIANAIVNWMKKPEKADPDAPVYDYYLPKNGPLSTLDELLLVRGVTANLLYGNDRNRNGKVDPGESDGADFNRGWSDYLTVYGHELNIDSTGAPRIYLNDTITADMQKALTDALGAEMANYILAYRMFGSSSSLTPAPSTTRPGSMQELNDAVALSMAAPRSRKKFKNSPLAMLNSRVTLPRPPGTPQNEPSVVIECPLNNRDTFNELLPLLLDKTTAKSAFELNPRININTAPQDLLMALPGLTAEDVAAAISARQTVQPGTAEYSTGAWMVTRAGQRPEIFQQQERYSTGQTMTYRIHSIGYFAKGGPVSRVEAVIDTNQGKPRIIYFRDLTDLGGGFTPPR